MQIVLWPLLIVILRTLSLTWWRTSYFVQNNGTILPGDTRQITSELPNYGAKLETWGLKMFHNFNFVQSYMVFGITNAFPWIFYAVSSEKSCATPMLFLLSCIELSTVEFFPPAESWLVDSNFRHGSCMQSWSYSVLKNFVRYCK